MDHNSAGRKAPKSTARFVVTILLVCALLLGAGGIAFAWLTIQAKHVVSGAVRIAPTVSGPLDTKPKPFDRDAYAAFPRTQAVLLPSNTSLLQHVADQLAARKLAFFSPAQTPPGGKPGPQDPERILRQAIAHGVIKAAAIPDTELLEITMVSENPEEAKTIVDCFLNTYVAQFENAEDSQRYRNLNLLSNKLTELKKVIQNRRAEINHLAESYGTTPPGPLEEMELQRQKLRTEEFLRTQQRRESLEAALESSGAEEAVAIDSNDLLTRRQTYVDSDPVIQALARRVADLRVELATPGEKEPNDPAARQRQQKTLDALDQQLDVRRRTREQQFDAEHAEILKRQAQQRLDKTRLELPQVSAYYKRLQSVLDIQDSKERVAGRTQMDIQDRQFQLQVDQDQYDKIYRRIKQMEMEQARPSRVTVAYLAELKDLVDNRRPWEWSLAVLGATLLLSTALLLVRRVLRSRAPTGDHP